MKWSEILENYTNRGERERRKGYYWSSEVYNIRKGRVTPENFFSHEPIDAEGCARIQRGVATEAHIVRILEGNEIDFEHEPKKYITLPDETWHEEKPEIEEEQICLTVKPDFVFENTVWELKHSSRVYDKIKRWYYDQLECEAQMFPDKKIYLVMVGDPFNLHFLPYKRSKRRWGNIKKLLREFNQKL